MFQIAIKPSRPPSLVTDATYQCALLLLLYPRGARAAICRFAAGPEVDAQVDNFWTEVRKERARVAFAPRSACAKRRGFISSRFGCSALRFRGPGTAYTAVIVGVRVRGACGCYAGVLTPLDECVAGMSGEIFRSVGVMDFHRWRY